MESSTKMELFGSGTFYKLEKTSGQTIRLGWPKLLTPPSWQIYNTSKEATSFLDWICSKHVKVVLVSYKKNCELTQSVRTEWTRIASSTYIT